MKLSLILLALAGIASANNDNEGLKKIKHVVLFMQENRAFDHYFGTMPGVRGFQDPNAHVSENTGKSVFYQEADEKDSKGVPFLKYWWINYLGGEWKERTQCLLAGTNAWQQNHEAYNDGSMDQWAKKNTPYSVSYFRREDVPTHFDIAENFVVGDSYYESIISSTDTNRAVWFSGTINAPGSPTGGDGPKMGGPVYDNNRLPGCENFTPSGKAFSCRPLKWKTIPEYLEEAGISWRVYQDIDNFTDDTLVQWEQYQEQGKWHGPLARKGTSRPGLEKFVEDAKNGNLPEVSYIVGPTDLSEHPPMMPNSGAWLQRWMVETVMNSKDWDSTALLISYDETGGLADHVMSPHAPQGTPGEWVKDPYEKHLGEQPIGPGFRLPFYIVSPFTRNGGVFTEHSAHESQIMFLEEWAKAHGKPFHSKEINPWRRKHLSNLVKAFDFSKSDTSVANISEQKKPAQEKVTGLYYSVALCLARWLGPAHPPVPYGGENLNSNMDVESGFKPVRGDVTEGRYLAFEAWDYALTKQGDKLGASHKTDNHDNKDQLFVVHWQGTEPRDQRFYISTFDKTKFVTENLGLGKSSDAAEFAIKDLGNGAGHIILNTKTGKQINVGRDGSVSWKDGNASTYEVFSVTV